jgi:cystinosin
MMSFCRDIEVSVTVIHSEALDVVIEVVGWIYFIAWSISFYPQIVYNFQRKSVVGLNFDFLTYNLTGFLLYGMFNVGMFWITTVKV